MSVRRVTSWLAAGLLGSGALPGAAIAQEALRSVEIKGLKDPELRRYRSVSADLDAFELYRALSPQVGTLRFRLAKATLVDGQRSQDIAIDLLESGYESPLTNAAWSDDALLELAFATIK